MNAILSGIAQGQMPVIGVARLTKSTSQAPYPFSARLFSIKV
jgi:hypothetical protein